MDEALRHATAAEIRAWYAAGELSPTEFTRATLALLAEREPVLHAFVTVTADLAMDQARRAERRIRELGAAAWDRRPLLGVPVSVKDLTPTAGVRTTRGSLRTARWIPEVDAPAVTRLKDAGAVLVGKTTTSEGGWSAGTVNQVGPAAANPWDPTRSAGGSSGGAAAATAAGIGVAALGTDGAGSIRVPAAFCGVVGYKPTFGRAPYVPVSPEGLSHIGPLARDVATAGLVARVISGPHPDDPLSTVPPVPAAFSDTARVAWLRWPVDSTEPERVAHAAASALAGDMSEVDIPFADPYDVLVTILAGFDAGQDEADDALSDPHRMRVVAHGRTLTAADLARAISRRTVLCQAVDRLLAEFDILAMPTVWIEPFPVDAWRPDPGDDLGWLAWCRAAYPFNLTGHPAISLPAGFTTAGYPVGLQLVARRGADEDLLRVAEQFEADRPWRGRDPRKDKVRR
ncbi:amidase [Actinokineospora xionganensis]|uniref:Amidase n=1 Tax=Actinokineospora xionganensis TaxID=2684470 RepID=A0ABR7L818_9PSEU|nr:amidase family protein [Actinokineospora xionganensis]MBC6448643.1 amidase [Actinokineospora xionganensis]